MKNTVISKEEIIHVLEEIRHGAIDRTLKDLGIIQDIQISGDRVAVTLAFPFSSVPIKDYIIMSVRVPLEKLGLKVDVNTTVMAPEQTERFLELEEKYWKY